LRVERAAAAGSGTGIARTYNVDPSFAKIAAMSTPTKLIVAITQIDWNCGPMPLARALHYGHHRSAAGPWKERGMVHSREKASTTERELQAYTDELGIHHHAERLAANLGLAHALEELNQVRREIAAQCEPVALAAKAARK
jgi:hypothetical protein